MSIARLPSPAAAPEFPRNASPALMAAIVAAHLLAAWGLLQLGDWRRTVMEPLPLTVRLVSAPAPAPRPLPTPVSTRPVAARLASPRPAPAPMPQPTPTLAAASDGVVTPPSTLPATAPTPPQPAATPEPAPVAAAAEAPPPTVVELTSGQIAFWREPQLVYPPLSVSRRESGTVVLRVVVDEHGQMQELRIERSSGHARLDAAALAAMRTARFKPYVHQGRPTAFVALKPMVFELT